MSLFGGNIKIDGVVCAMVMRGPSNGQYRAVFEREYANLERIEAIRWARPTIEGKCVLPAGYSFVVTDIEYSNATRSYTVELETARQYLGDVTGYQAEVEALRQELAAAAQTAAERAGQLAEADELAITLYEENAALQEQLAQADELVIALYEAANGEEGTEE